MLKDRIKSLAQAYKQEVIDLRRHLHAHPELSFKEYETAAFVARNRHHRNRVQSNYGLVCAKPGKKS